MYGLRQRHVYKGDQQKQKFFKFHRTLKERDSLSVCYKCHISAADGC